jgi:hypothetical protein
LEEKLKSKKLSTDKEKYGEPGFRRIQMKSSTN